MDKNDRNILTSTAEGIAFHRALEMLLPPPMRVCEDRYASHFLSPPFVALLNDPDRIKILIDRAAKEVPGVNGTIIARVRFFDDYLNQCLVDGFQQIVLLGAGFDSRAYRFDNIHRKAKVYELDRLDIQSQKTSVLKRLFGQIPKHVSFVSVDFESENFGKKLIDAGFNQDQPAFFIWEGVTMYLCADEVDATLSFISNKCTAGSRIIFDYFPATIVEGTCNLPEAQGLRERVNAINENFCFSIAPNQVNDLLESHDFSVILNVNAQKLKSRYFKDAAEHRPVSSLFNFAVAEVQ